VGSSSKPTMPLQTDPRAFELSRHDDCHHWAAVSWGGSHAAFRTGSIRQHVCGPNLFRGRIRFGLGGHRFQSWRIPVLRVGDSPLGLMFGPARLRNRTKLAGIWRELAQSALISVGVWYAQRVQLAFRRFDRCSISVVVLLTAMRHWVLGHHRCVTWRRALRRRRS
jgi:hypothetical protein